MGGSGKMLIPLAPPPALSDDDGLSFLGQICYDLSRLILSDQGTSGNQEAKVTTLSAVSIIALTMAPLGGLKMLPEVEIQERLDFGGSRNQDVAALAPVAPIRTTQGSKSFPAEA